MIGLQPYSEVNNNLLSSQQLVPESESEQREAQANLTEAAQDPNQSSEEPKADYAQEGKPRGITY